MSLTTRPDDTAIVDRDLVDALEGARGTPAFEFSRIKCLAEQERRNALAALGRDKRRRLAARHMIESEPLSRDDLRHIHSVLAICGLPYRRLPESQREYERKQGRMALVVEAGKLRSAQTGERIAQPVPFGPKARLLMMHLCSEAVRQKSPVIEIADNLTSFMREIGYEPTGGKRGNLPAFKEQLNALAAARLSIAVWDTRGGMHERFIQPFSAIDIWMPTNPDERMLWPTTLTFGAEFYESLTRHALPVNIHAVRAFSTSARKLDLYFWLGYRMANLDASKTISWSALADQFGSCYESKRFFRRDFALDLEAISDVLPKLPLKLDETGLALAPVDPADLALPAPRRHTSVR